MTEAIHSKIYSNPSAGLLKQYPSMAVLCGSFPEDSQPPYLYITAFLKIKAVYPYRYSQQPWEGWCLLYTQNGQGSVAFGGQSAVLGQQKLYLWPCSQGFSIRTVSSHWNHFLLYLNGREMEYFHHQFTRSSSQPVPVPDHSCLPDLFSSLSKKDKDAFASPLQQLFLTTALLTEALSVSADIEENPLCPDYLLAVRRMLDEEYRMPCSLDLLEKRFQISKYRISREFSQFFHQAPISYLNQRRIQAAKNLLIATDDKINVISEKTGFASPNLFIRSFKKETGVTPQVYRKNNSRLHL